MKWFSNLSVSKKLGLGFGGLLTLMLACNLFSFWQMAKVNRATVLIAKGRLPSVRALGQVREDVGRLRRAELGWLTAQEKGRPKWETMMAAAGPRILDDEKKYEVTIDSEEERQLYQKTHSLILQYLDIHQQVVSLWAQGKQEESQAVCVEKGLQVTTAIRDAIDKTIDANDKSAEVATRNAAEDYARARRSLVVLAAISAAFGLLLMTMTSRDITIPLGKLVQCLHHSADGDLTTRIEVSSQDDVGRVSMEFNAFMQKLQDAMRQLTSSSQQLAGASEEMSAAANQSAAGSQTQSDQAHQVATAIEEMAATVNQVSDNSHKAADAARKAAGTAGEGGKVVDDVLATMRSIAESVGATAQKIEALGKNSDQIGKIIAVIDEIADQTNLLALNAAIEAARAGEQGRGFAVVADEVRKLAERTTKATKEIAQMIETVQVETRTAVANMQTGTQQVEVGVQTTTRAGQSLDEIIQAAQLVGDMVTQIATATSQQSSTSDQIKANVAQIAKISGESAAGAQQSAKACEELSNLALDLQALVSKFNVGENASAPSSLARRNSGHRSGYEMPDDLHAVPQTGGRPNGHGARHA
jgi:methyl-accepting chemotaxis protein